MLKLIVAITGASGALAAKILVEKSPWPISLVVSDWGKNVYEQECGSLAALEIKVNNVYKYADLTAPISSGSVETKGMVIIPCSCNTLGEIASGISNNLITRAAHCHLKEKRKLIICLRETPLSLIEMENGAKITKAGGVIMPICPPFYMAKNSDPAKVSSLTLMQFFIDRVFAILGHKISSNWENIQ